MGSLAEARTAIEKFIFDNLKVYHEGSELPLVVNNAGGDDALEASDTPYLSATWTAGSPEQRSIGTNFIQEYEGSLDVLLFAPLNIGPIDTTRLVSEVVSALTYKQPKEGSTTVRLRGATIPDDGRTVGTHHVCEIAILTKFLM